jgi:AcrR family transcriptional regulator
MGKGVFGGPDGVDQSGLEERTASETRLAGVIRCGYKGTSAPALNMSRSGQNKQLDTALADRLIDAAEMLYATHGIGGASLRQISAAAGTANNYAVQYHFGDMAGLIRAVLEKRTPDIERRRAALLAKAKEAGLLSDLRALNEVLYRPLIEHESPDGERWFARFLLALFTSPAGLKLARGTEQLAPISAHILDLQCAANPAVPELLVRERHRMIVTMLLMSVLNRHEPFNEGLDAALVDNALDMATAALGAPVSKAVRAKLKKSAAPIAERRARRKSPA